MGWPDNVEERGEGVRDKADTKSPEKVFDDGEARRIIESGAFGSRDGV